MARLLDADDVFRGAERGGHGNPGQVDTGNVRCGGPIAGNPLVTVPKENTSNRALVARSSTAGPAASKAFRAAPAALIFRHSSAANVCNRPLRPQSRT